MFSAISSSRASFVIRAMVEPAGMGMPLGAMATGASLPSFFHVSSSSWCDKRVTRQARLHSIAHLFFVLDFLGQTRTTVGECARAALQYGQELHNARPQVAVGTDLFHARERLLGLDHVGADLVHVLIDLVDLLTLERHGGHINWHWKVVAAGRTHLLVEGDQRPDAGLLGLLAQLEHATGRVQRLIRDRVALQLQHLRF